MGRQDETRAVRPTNEAIADALEDAAAALEERGANPHRVQAYLNAAETVRQEERALADLYEEGGLDALRALPAVGDSLGARIAGFVETGELRLLRRLRAETPPEALFTRVNGIGRELAKRIHDKLGIETLEELELAAYDGRLGTVEGFGVGRVRDVQAQLNVLLSRATRRQMQRLRRALLDGDEDQRRPPIDQLLSVDAEYQERSAVGALRTIAPRRFNPSGEAWLPVLHTVRKPWSYTALFSNTARAHELGKTDDWVVVYAERGGQERQYTVVTETRGALKGRRVVRGREAECRTHYDNLRPLPQAA